jgi:chemotaxis protein methyltransferase CheR
MSEQAIIEEARNLLAQGRYNDALAMLDRIPIGSALAARALGLTARVYADQGQLDRASSMAQRAIERDPLDEESYLLLGVVAARQGQWRTAVQQLERARYLCPESALISFHLAAALHQTGQKAQAHREYRSTLWKLREHPPDALLDGVAVAWLRDTCERQIERLGRELND